MPEHSDGTPSLESLPPGPLALSAAEIFQQFLPQVIKTATDSAASSSAAASALVSMESQLTEMRVSIDNNTAALRRVADGKERENELLAEQNRLLGVEKGTDNEKNKRWHDTVRAMFPGPVVAQIGVQFLMLLGLALGMYQVMPMAPQVAPSGTLAPSTSENPVVPGGAHMIP